MRLAEHVVLGDPAAGLPQAPLLVAPRERESRIEIGAKTVLTNGVEIIARESVSIGRQCVIGAGVRVLDSDFHALAPDGRRRPGETRPVVIEDNVFLGMGAMVLKGVRIGRDAVVGAGAVVTKDVAAGAVVAGNPARPVGSVYEDHRRKPVLKR